MKRPLIGIYALILAIFFIACDMGTDPTDDMETPTVTITQPADGDTVSGLVEIVANASDNEGIDSVQFFIDNMYKDSDKMEPWNYVWNTSEAEDSINHALYTIAVDQSGNIDTSEVVSVFVYNSSEPALSILLTQPTDGDTVKGQVEIAAEVSDNQQVDSVKFYVDDELQGAVTTAPWSTTWDASGVDDSTAHSISASAIDTAGIEYTSVIITVVVNNHTVSFTNDIQPVFTENCAFSGCHGTSNPQQGLVLAEGEAYGNIVNVPSQEESGYDLIEPNMPDSSYIYLKIQPDPPSGEQMPRGGPYLDSETINMIETWISEGALNN
ncbi:MAG: Chitodextrinase [Candidatus Marinimicrobia bacterium]|nr:Chitodextrinase [Candidatus Neomarinimicrobiota bacterium]